MTEEVDQDIYALKSAEPAVVAAPDIPYRPPAPKNYRPRIGMIGTGGISAAHLDAYRTAGWDVAALWNRTRAKAEAKAAEFYPRAQVLDGWQAMIDTPDIDVIDVTLHPEHRAPVIDAALKAGKHVLSQKPFVEDLLNGERLVDLARENNVKLAVNQNGRWSPHMAWMRGAVRAGLIGEVISAHVTMQWDHGWTAGTLFDDIEDLVFWDFGVHWFDFISSILGDRVESVFATTTSRAGQVNKVPLMAQALVRAKGAQASLVFDGGVPLGARDSTVICGTKGMLTSDGPDLGSQQVTLTTEEGVARPELKGLWFNDGFRGAMGELLVAIEEGSEPENSAAGNLASLALTFAAIAARRTGKEVAVGSVQRLDG
ncbi:Gfo/Idh/MocA family oxidoreductase [uncultured Ruegeria sp.]|uniref:Gfo/Idh/MocA family protein n=1 Tax=uncultured Ruegeria sp. TaxID=259304 RepID=UPI00262E4DC5|nr:Gfo/Idh/MocA family oxidoreductase [uncultured Ruegeria sp.]